MASRHMAAHLPGEIAAARYSRHSENDHSVDLMYAILSIFFMESNLGILFSHTTKQTVSGI